MSKVKFSNIIKKREIFFILHMSKEHTQTTKQYKLKAKKTQMGLNISN